MESFVHRLIDKHQHKPWAILPHYLDGLIQKSAGGKEAFFFGDDTPDAPPLVYEVDQDGVASVVMHGPLLKEPDKYERKYLGAISTVDAETVIRMALADASVKGVLLDIDSPGGTVDGSFSLAEAVYAMRGDKPIVAFANGLAASAGYLLASAADKIFLNEAGEVGSIGVRMTHIDWTKWNEKYGIAVNIITSGKFKAAGDPDLALDEEARAYFQDMINETHAMFVAKVARNRGISLESVQPVADGRVFMGQAALANQLVDQIGERADALAAVLTYQKERVDSRQERIPIMGIMDAVKRVLSGKPLEEGDPAEATEIVETVKAAIAPPAPETPAATEQSAPADSGAAAKDERARAASIAAAVQAAGLGLEFAAELIGSDRTEAQALRAVIDKAAEGQKPLTAVTSRAANPTEAAQAEQGLVKAAQELAESRKK